MKNLDALNEYDLGREGSLYFKDGVDECNKDTKTLEYCDCGNNFICITTEESKPYIQKYEILAPVFISTTWGSEKYFRLKVKRCMWIDFGVTDNLNEYLITVNYPMKVGDIFRTNKDCCAKYYVKSKKGKNLFNEFVYNIARTDFQPMKVKDIEKFDKKTVLNICGFFREGKRPSC